MKRKNVSVFNRIVGNMLHYHYIKRNPFARASIAIFLLVWLCSTSSYAQINMSIRSVDTSRFPFIELKTRIIEGNRVPVVHADDVQLFENTVPQQITISCPDQTVSIILILDKSTSMAFYPNSQDRDPDSVRWRSAKNALRQFVDQMSTQDEAAFVTFSRYVSIDQNFTANKTALKDAIYGITLGPYTALWKAIDSCITLLSARPNKRAIVVLTDGQDNSSFPITLPNVINHAKQNGVKIFSVGLGDDIGREGLDSLARSTGGIFYFSATGSDLSEIYSTIIQQIPDDCSIQYTSTNPCSDSTLRSIRVIANINEQAASDDTFYVAPKQIHTIRLDLPSNLYLRLNEEVSVPIKMNYDAQINESISFTMTLDFDSTLFRFVRVERKNTACENATLQVTTSAGQLNITGSIAEFKDSSSIFINLIFTSNNTREGGIGTIKFRTHDFTLRCRTNVVGSMGKIIVDGTCKKIAVSKNVLHQNSPNPFNPSTNIRFHSSAKHKAHLVVMNILGKVVSEKKWIVEQGDHIFTFVGINLPSGMYFYKLHLGNWSDIKKMLLIR